MLKRILALYVRPIVHCRASRSSLLCPGIRHKNMGGEPDTDGNLLPVLQNDNCSSWKPFKTANQFSSRDPKSEQL
jgi:hypothetical protein